MDSDRYHVLVRTRIGTRSHVWRPVRPVGGEPYVLTRDEGERYIEDQSKSYGRDPSNWRLERYYGPVDIQGLYFEPG